MTLVERVVLVALAVKDTVSVLVVVVDGSRLVLSDALSSLIGSLGGGMTVTPSCFKLMGTRFPC